MIGWYARAAKNKYPGSSSPRCVDCGWDTQQPGRSEYYMVEHEVWEAAGMPRWLGGQMCIGCLEKRIGRKLTRADFMDVPLNDPDGFPGRSRRLQDRLTS